MKSNIVLPLLIVGGVALVLLGSKGAKQGNAAVTAMHVTLS